MVTKDERYFGQQKVLKAIEGNFSTYFSMEQKEKVDESAYTSIILHLSGIVLRKVGKLKTMKELWKKLDNLYLLKSNSNNLCLLVRFFNLQN